MIKKIVLVFILLILLIFIYFFLKNIEMFQLGYNFILNTPYISSKHKVDKKKSKIQITKYTQNIPFKIHQTDNSQFVDYNIYKAVKINQQINPEYDFFFYDEQDRTDFILKYFPQYIKHYESIIPGAYKADLFRLLVLYQEGGVYLDSKSFCITSFREIIKPTDNLYMVIDPSPGCIHNGFICSIPGHPIIKMCIDQYIFNVEKKYYGKNSLDIGGPQMIGRIVNTFFGKDELADITPFEKDGIRISGRMKWSAGGETVIVSEEDQIYIERSNNAYNNRKIMDIFTGKCYNIKWMTGRVYK